MASFNLKKHYNLCLLQNMHINAKYVYTSWGVLHGSGRALTFILPNFSLF